MHSQDAIDTLNIPIGDKNSKDEIFGRPDKKGIFSVKSVYHLAIKTNTSKEASQSDNTKTSSFWKNIWNSGVLPRTKVCAWKIVNDIIPTKANILKKRD